jgi:dienelactone hydrolase
MKCATRLAHLVLLLVCASGMLAAEQAAGQDRIAAAEGFVDLLVKEDFAGAFGTFDAQMQSAIPEARLRDVWTGINTKAGRFQRRVRSKALQMGAYDVVLVTCQFEKTPLDVKVVFNAGGKVSGLFFAPTAPEPAAEPPSPAYVKEGSFQERDVTVGSGDWILPGTLSVPVGEGPFPAVVLVHGSGPQDRDETIGPNKPFRDLAWGLSSNGIAVLRYEKRTKQQGAKMAGLTSLTVKEETVDDAVAAVQLLRTIPTVDAKGIFVLGHSLGGMLIPRIGGRDPAIAGLIVLAGTTRPLEDVLVEQVEYIDSLGTPSEAASKQLEDLKAQSARIKTLDPSKAEPAEPIMGVPVAYWLDLRGYRPAEAARQLKIPMLILQGERDYQVTPTDFKNWKDALADRPDVVCKTYADLNHLFMAGQGKATPAEYDRPGHVAATVVEDIAAWIKR